MPEKKKKKTKKSKKSTKKPKKSVKLTEKEGDLSIPFDTPSS
jgi:hypothetical protein